MDVVEGLQGTFDDLMREHPEADGEFFATAQTKAFTYVKISGKMKKREVIDDGEPIEDMEEPFYET